MNILLSAAFFTLLTAVDTLVADQPPSNVFSLQCYENIKSITLRAECEHSDTLSLESILNPIYGLSLDMTIERTSELFLVRILMEDEAGKSYLVAEDYPMLGNQAIERYDGYCEETALMWNVVPKCLRIHSYGAKVTIFGLKITASLDKSCNSSEKVIDKNREILKQQAKLKSEAISECIKSQDKLWFAGVTSLSIMPFSDRMRVMGFSETCQTNGMEFYCGGIYDMVSIGRNANGNNLAAHNPSTTCISEFDWRNRHGKDWLTPVKDQGDSGYCTAFSAVSCLEALANLYYNRKLDLDLSEQEAAVCCDDSNPWYGIPFSSPLFYIVQNGVCDENAYPFVNDSLASKHCMSEEVSPNEIVSIDSYSYIQYFTEENVKKALINYGPLHTGFEVDDYTDTIPQKAHAMALYGYKVIEEGDIIHWLETYGNIGSHGMHDTIVVAPGNNLIGRTAWKFKNSYTNGNSSNPQYMYITFDELSHMLHPCILNTPITTMNYTDDDIVCEDADGDGYYFWGIGTKPRSCPFWVPEDPDGDDSNTHFGPMDDYGYMSEVNPCDSAVLYLEGAVPSFVNDTILRNAVISSGTTFELHGSLRFLYGATLTVESDAYFLIDGGKLITANLILMPGSTIVFDNNGEYVPPFNSSFVVPEGAILNLIKGTIHKHNQQPKNKNI